LAIDQNEKNTLKKGLHGNGPFERGKKASQLPEFPVYTSRPGDGAMATSVIQLAFTYPLATWAFSLPILSQIKNFPTK
jgi:hypothetical protein